MYKYLWNMYKIKSSYTIKGQVSGGFEFSIFVRFWSSRFQRKMKTPLDRVSAGLDYYETCTFRVGLGGVRV